MQVFPLYSVCVTRPTGTGIFLSEMPECVLAVEKPRQKTTVLKMSEINC